MTKAGLGKSAETRSEYWRGRIAEHERSGMSVGRFCQEQQITERAPDGNGFYLSCIAGKAPTVLYADLQGNTKVVFRMPIDTSDWYGVDALPSLDGRHIAIEEALRSGDVWLIDGL